MNDQFDELARGLAQSVTRRAALKKFGVGIAGVVLAILGLTNKASAQSCLPYGSRCHSPRICQHKCCSGVYTEVPADSVRKPIFVCL